MNRPDWTSRPPRSWLFVPGTRPDLLAKAAASEADAIILDLEDAVAPGDRRRARQALPAAEHEIGNGPPWFVRLSATTGTDAADEIAAAAHAGAHGLVLPKVASAVDLLAVVEMADRASRDGGRAPLGLVAMIESARGLIAGVEIAAASNRVVGIAFGAEDFSVDVGLRRAQADEALAHARSHVVLVAAAAGRWAIDSPSLELRDRERVQDEAAHAWRLGFVGKFAVHPAQLSAINKAFSPTADEVMEAEAVVHAFEASIERGGPAILAVDGRMVDQPVVDAARRLLQRHARTTTARSHQPGDVR